MPEVNLKKEYKWMSKNLATAMETSEEGRVNIVIEPDRGIQTRAMSFQYREPDPDEFASEYANIIDQVREKTTRERAACVGDEDAESLENSFMVMFLAGWAREELKPIWERSANDKVVGGIGRFTDPSLIFKVLWTFTKQTIVGGEDGPPSLLVISKFRKGWFTSQFYGTQ